MNELNGRPLHIDANTVESGAQGMSRRSVVTALGTAAAAGMFGAAPSLAQTPPVLPLNTPGLDHLDIVVPDVEAAAKFYMSVFNTKLHAQPFQGAQRYFILLGELNERREAGYVAIGAARGRDSYIGHFCTSVVEWRRDSAAIFAAMSERFAEAGFGTFPGGTGVGGIFSDPDGIEIQFLPAPDTVVTAAVPSDLVPPNQGMVTPRGVDHMLLLVSDLDRAVQYYEILYGPAASRDANTGRVIFQFAASQLILEQARYEYGQTPKIAHYCIKVDAFDRQIVEAGLRALGAELLDAGEPGVLRFRDLDGIQVELKAV